MNSFYLFHDPNDLPDRKYAEWTENVHTGGIICSKYPGHQRSDGKRISKLEILMPNNNDDIIWTWYSDCLINEKVLSLLIDSKVTGFKVGNVSILKDKRKINFGKKIYELIVNGRGGGIDPSSGYKVLDVCQYCGWKKIQGFNKGLIVNETCWDGSDFFVLDEYPRFRLVTSKVREIFENNHIKSCLFEKAETYKSRIE